MTTFKTTNIYHGVCLFHTLVIHMSLRGRPYGIQLEALQSIIKTLSFFIESCSNRGFDQCA